MRRPQTVTERNMGQLQRLLVQASQIMEVHYRDPALRAYHIHEEILWMIGALATELSQLDALPKEKTV